MKGSRRSTAFGIGAVVTIVLLAFALIYANAYSTRLVTANSRSLHWANATLGSAAILRAASNQAVLFGRELDLGVADQAAVDLSAGEADRAGSAFLDAATAGHPEMEADSRLDTLIGDVALAAEDAVTELRSGDWETASTILDVRLEPGYRELTNLLVEEQEATIARIDETEDFAGWVSGAIRFFTILLIPTIALFVYRRITRRQIREQRREMNARLEYERKMSEAKDELIAAVSHQLRTPLTGIYGMSHVLVGDALPDEETRRELLDTIHSEAYELDRMVADLVAMARLESDTAEFREEAVEVGKVIELAVDPARRAGHRVIVVESEETYVTADQARLIHIIRSLLSNARKHGGPTTRVFADAAAGRVAITVEDDGPGAQDEEAMFAGFTNEGRAALVAGSIGLGLAVARALARQMNGDLVYNRIRGKSRFTIVLPLHGPPAPKAEPSVATAARQ